VPVDLGPVGPGEDGVAGELATIVADDHLWLAALCSFRIPMICSSVKRLRFMLWSSR
jgi:hypothetical protein